MERDRSSASRNLPDDAAGCQDLARSLLVKEPLTPLEASLLRTLLPSGLALAPEPEEDAWGAPSPRLAPLQRGTDQAATRLLRLLCHFSRALAPDYGAEEAAEAQALLAPLGGAKGAGAAPAARLLGVGGAAAVAGAGYRRWRQSVEG